MTLLDSITAKLQHYPELVSKVEANTISVTPRNGFTVWATDQKNYYTIGFEGWHEDFKDLEEALNCFAWGLTNECRLMIFSRGNRPYKWTVQCLENGEWLDVSSTGLIFVPFWRAAKVSYKQNHVIT